MSNIKIGYKIVTVEDGRYFSMGKGFLLGQPSAHIRLEDTVRFAFSKA